MPRIRILKPDYDCGKCADFIAAYLLANSPSIFRAFGLHLCHHEPKPSMYEEVNEYLKNKKKEKSGIPVYNKSRIVSTITRGN